MAGFDYTVGPKGLADNINKVETGDVPPKDGVSSSLVPELELKMTDEEILTLTQKWEASYQSYEGDIKKKQDESERYWLGKQFYKAEVSGEERPLVDNLIFESLETFLPEANKTNPEPVVTADNTPEGIALSKDVKTMLVAEADRQTLRLKLKKMTRFWSLYFLGVAKISWDVAEDNIDTPILRPQKLILDKNGWIDDAGEYHGEYIGERKEVSAARLIEIFSSKKDFIEKMVEGKMGTKVTYIEWWTDTELFFTLKDQVLEKIKNPHWNYEQQQKTVDDFGVEQMSTVPGRNHFKTPKKPYVFLSVFSLGKQPHDETSLIHQNLANQDMVNKKMRQIDKNTDNMNNGIVLSGDSFTKEQAAQASDALSQGDGLWVPTGDIARAYRRDQAPGLPSDVFNQLADLRNELRNIFGVRGSSAEGVSSEQTVRGKIIIGQKDSSRIGGGVTEYIEQVADSIFNWWVQMMMVYYTEKHEAAVLGSAKAQEMVSLQGSDFDRRLSVSVKEGSLIPKDALTERNEAVDLWAAGAIDPIELFTKLDFPDPRHSAEQLYLWQKAPELLFPEAAAKIQQATMAQQQVQPTQPTPIQETGVPVATTEQQPNDVLSSVPIQ